MKKRNPDYKLLCAIKTIIEKNGDFVFIGGLDENDYLKLADLGTETKVSKELTPHFELITAMVRYYFISKNLERNRTYIFKFFVKNGYLVTESFGAIPDFSMLRRVG